MLWLAVRWLLFRLDPERAHRLAHRLLRRVTPAEARRRRPVPPPALAVKVLGLDFDSPVGLAAGFDKGDVSVAGLFALGFSHVEIGTITPRPQPGNDPPRIFRLPEHRALVNRMGFNNEGADVCAERLAERAPGKPLLVKLAPDLLPEALDEAVDVAIAAGVAGIIATNTTLSRAGVEGHPRAGEQGGLSGAPLERLATSVVRRCAARAAGRVPIVGAGGVMSAEDAY